MHRSIAALLAASYMSAAGADSTIIKDELNYGSEALILKLSHGLASLAAEKPPEPVILAVRINGADQEADVDALRLSATDLAVPEEVIVAWRLRKPDAGILQIDGKHYISLTSLAGLQWQIDARTQTLVIAAEAAAFERTIVEPPVAADTLPSPVPPGGFVNYDLQHHWTNGTRSSVGLVELGAFNDFGTMATTMLLRDAGARRRQTRLESHLDLPLTERRQNIRLGDAIGHAGSWGRATRFGGLQWGTQFSMAPSQVTFPMPALRGEAVLPSTVDLFINDAYRMQSTVPAGLFELPNVPLVTGQGEVKMVVRDALGRQQIVVQPYYASRALLAPGLHEFSYEAGKVREDFGSVSNRYGRTFLAGTHRWGMNSTATLELRGELLKEQQTFGGGVQWVAPALGTVGMQTAFSRSAGQSGTMAGISMDRQSSWMSANGSARYYSRDFTQLGRSSLAIRSEIAAGAGMPLGGGGIGIGFAQQAAWTAERRRTLSLSFTRNLGKLGYFAVAASHEAGSIKGNAINFTWVHSLDSSTNLSLGTSRDQSGTHNFAQLQRATPVSTGLGYQINAEQGRNDRVSALGTWQTAYATLTGGMARLGGQDAYRLGASGGLALVDRSVYWSKRINDSFAVVRVGQYPDVDVLLENRVVGRTNAHGEAFIESLMPYERNRIGIDQSGLPFDAQIDKLHVFVTPPAHSGVSVRFPVRRQTSFTVRLQLPNGQPIPPGTVLSLSGTGRRFTVGYEGVVYLNDMQELENIVLEWPKQACSFAIAGTPRGKEPESGNVFVCKRSEK